MSESATQILLGAVTGMIAGVVAAAAVALAQRTVANRLRIDPRPRARGWWLMCGLMGLLGGIGWTWRLEGTWRTGMVAGLGLPALLVVVVVISFVRGHRSGE